MAVDVKSKLQSDMKDALKAKQKERLATIRLALAAIKQIEVDQQKPLDATGVIAAIQKMVKQRKESIKQYTEANRLDLAEKEEQELQILNGYLPQPLSEEELTALITTCIKDMGTTSVADMSKVMAAVKAKAAGRADMSKVSQLVKNQLS